MIKIHTLVSLTAAVMPHWHAYRAISAVLQQEMGTS